MKILIAPDKFKGSLSSLQAAHAIRDGFVEALPAAEFDICPIADGGEGTQDICVEAMDGEIFQAPCMDPLGRPITGRYGWISSAGMAIIEMSEASGLWRVSPGDRDPTRSHTFGTGQLIKAALDRGAKTVAVGLGGSATNDGGVGLAVALGWKFLDATGNDLGAALVGATEPARPASEVVARTIPSALESPGPGRTHAPLQKSLPATLNEIAKIVPPPRPLRAKIIALADVRNPLLGPAGCTHCYSPQKGASPADIDLMECALDKFAALCARQLNADFKDSPGAGAAGGTGFGLMTFCHAEVVSGFDWLSQLLNLEARVAAADLIVTGEGSIDAQTLEGKGPGALAAIAKKHGKRVIAFCGSASPSALGPFEACIPIADGSVALADAIRNAAPLLRERACTFARHGL